MNVERSINAIYGVTRLDITSLNVIPILDYIDAFQYKQALTLIEKLVRKHPQLLIVQSLKSLVLLRSGNKQDAVNLANVIRKEQPVERGILQPLMLVYRDVGNRRPGLRSCQVLH